MSIRITITHGNFEDVININRRDFDTQVEYIEFLRNIFKFEFNRFLINGDIVLEGEPYTEALDMYIQLDMNQCLDDAMDRIQAFNDYIDANNRF